MRWCTNDCHRKPMWCGRANCLNRAEYAEQRRKKEKTDDKKNAESSKVTEDFKIALAALTTQEDYALLESQFFQVKE